MKTIKSILLGTVAALAFGVVAQAQTLTIATGAAGAASQGASTSQSTSAGVSAIAGITAGTTSGASQNVGAAAGQSQTINGGVNTQAANSTTSQSQGNNASFALGGAANLSGSTALGSGTSAGAANGNFFTIKLAP